MFNDYGTWKPIPTKPLGLFSTIDEHMSQISALNPIALPNLHTSPTLFIATDYSGEHANADYQVISIVITDVYAIGDWNPFRLEVRQRYLPDGRRMSFKQLRDHKRWQGLIPFLSAANELRGLSATIAIHSSIDTLFSGSAPLDLSVPDFVKFAHWNKKTLEKLFRIIHFISVFLAGMSRAGQNVFWFTDDDSIAPNVQGLTELTELFAYVASGYLTHMLGHLRVGTPARSDTKDRLLEDLLAIPDLVAGTIAEVLTAHAGNKEVIVTSPPSVYLAPNLFVSDLVQSQSRTFKVFRGGQDKVMSSQSDMSAKTALILKWLGDSHQKLRRVALVIDPSPNSDLLSTGWITFHRYS
jgi:hypothetical protein